MAYAGTGDVAHLFGDLTGDQTLAAAVLLERVSALIRTAAPGIDARMATDADLALVVRGIAVDAVLRVLRNPQGFASETIADYGYRRADAVADGALYLTPRELAMLTVPSSARGAFTIRPGV